LLWSIRIDAASADKDSFLLLKPLLVKVFGGGLQDSTGPILPSKLIPSVGPVFWKLNSDFGTNGGGYNQ